MTSVVSEEPCQHQEINILIEEQEGYKNNIVRDVKSKYKM
jgi:hypothetical protein